MNNSLVSNQIDNSNLRNDWNFLKSEGANEMSMDRDFEVLFSNGDIIRNSDEYPLAELLAWRELSL